MKSIWLFAGTMLAALGCAAVTVHAQVTFARIARTGTTIAPGTATPFSNFIDESFGSPVAPAVDGTNVAFLGNTSTGVYRNVAGFNSLVANTSTPVPNHTTNFRSFRGPSISGINVAFYGQAQDGGDFRIGIYSRVGTSLNRIADNSVTAPGGPTFEGFGHTSIEGTAVSFSGDTTLFSEGIYRGSSYATLATIADTNTNIPSGSGKFQVLGSHVNTSAAGSGSNVVFRASGSDQNGMYKHIDGVGLRRVADQTTPAPGGTGNLAGFSNLNMAIDGPNAAFLAYTFTTLDVHNLYAEINGGISSGGSIRRIAGDGDARPGGGTFDFSEFSTVSYDNGSLAFSDTSSGIYLTNAAGGPITRLIGTGDPLDTRTVNAVAMGANALSDGNVGFWVRFTDGTQGIYLANNAVPIPEPATGAALLLLSLPILRRAGRSTDRAAS